MRDQIPTSLSHQQHQEAAAALVEAEQRRRWIDPLTATHPAMTDADAYAISQLVTQQKVASGHVVKGHKVGYTSAPMRDRFGASEPDYGTLFDTWFVDEGSEIPLSRLNRPWVEIEIAFVLSSPLGGPDVNAADVALATEFVMPAIEIVDSRYNRDGPNGGVIDSIADAASCGLVALGGQPLPPAAVDLKAIEGGLYVNGELMESGTGAAVMGNPINAVAWLARKLAQFGVVMEAGHTVLSGSFIAAVEAKPGDHIVARLPPMADVELRIEGLPA